ncbi:MAG: GtrA family protein [Solirubrobacteraceae bacterium]
MLEHASTTAELPIGVRLRHGVQRTHIRVAHGVRHPQNWIQLCRFGAVGASGYLVNLAAFAACVHPLSINYKIASVIAFLVAVVNNFWWNRHWTFGAKQHHPMKQAIRFFAVSLVAFGFSYAVLVSLVDGAGLDKVVAQAIAVVAAMPLSFVGQKLWSFKT